MQLRDPDRRKIRHQIPRESVAMFFACYYTDSRSVVATGKIKDTSSEIFARQRLSIRIFRHRRQLMTTTLGSTDVSCGCQ